MKFGLRLLPLLALPALSLGCSGSSATPAPSGAECPKDSTLTYENFAKGFFDTYCIDCHSTELKGSERHGAPLEHDFNTLEAIRAVEVEHIDEQAAAGPDAVNEFMPASDTKPTLEERKKLGEWLACDRP